VFIRVRCESRDSLDGTSARYELDGPRIEKKNPGGGEFSAPV